MYSERIVMKLNEIAYRYKDIVHRAVHDVITKTIRNTGEAAASLTVDVIEGNRDKAPVLVISFVDYLIYFNHRRIEWTKLPNIDKLTAWAEVKVPDRKAAKRLAFAVAWDKRKNDTWRAKPWRRRGLSGVLKEMNELILDSFDQVINEELQEAAKPNTAIRVA